MLGFEALAALPLSTLPAIVVADDVDEGSVPNTWTMGRPLRWPNLWPDEEIIFLRRKTSSRAGV